MPDERTAEDFRFQFDPCVNPANERHEGCCWYWQKLLLDEWGTTNRHLALKARQLGVTWLAGGKGLHTALYRPGSLVLVYRQKEEDAAKIIQRIWDMLNSLPQHLWNGGRVISPSRGARPYKDIELEFPDGRLSTIRGMSSSETAGHGETSALVIMDEFSRIEKAGELMKAVQPAAGSKGKIIIVSTANGRSNELTGEGNYFHWLWVNAVEAGFTTRFLAWSLHPDRDQHLYDHDPEVRGLKPHERAEQYPADPHEAFTFSNRVYFDKDALGWYGANATISPLYRCRFEPVTPHNAARLKDEQGSISVYEEPQEGHTYALAADVATGRGLDYSTAYVIDLATMALAAEFRARLDVSNFTFQLHYLGKWFNNARLAVEMGGGFGEPVLIFLRDGKEGRPPYPKLYRHRVFDRTDMPIKKEAGGFPMNTKTRPLVIGGLERAIREHSFPWLTHALLAELGTFVHRETNPSPRASDGCNDDLVMACAIATELYRQFGEHPDQRRPKRVTNRHRHWLKLGNP